MSEVIDASWGEDIETLDDGVRLIIVVRRLPSKEVARAIADHLKRSLQTMERPENL